MRNLSLKLLDTLRARGKFRLRHLSSPMLRMRKVDCRLNHTLASWRILHMNVPACHSTEKQRKENVNKWRRVTIWLALMLNSYCGRFSTKNWPKALETLYESFKKIENEKKTWMQKKHIDWCFCKLASKSTKISP